MSSNYVDNIMLYADPLHSYCVALVVPSHKDLEKWAQEAGIKYQNISELCDKAETIKEVQQSLSKVWFLYPLKGLLGISNMLHVHTTFDFFGVVVNGFLLYSLVI